MQTSILNLSYHAAVNPALWIGSSSWSEKAWSGPFYPAGVRPADYLRYYATRFPAVEADTTYYRVPSRDLVRGWDTKTPAGFRLSAKFPRAIVHAGVGPSPDGERVLVPEHVQRETDAFLEGMGFMGPKCGPLVLQFPYFNRTAFADRAPFLERLDRYLGNLPKEFRYVVEIRNKAWFDEEFLDLLRRHSAAPCLLDLLYMPHPLELSKTLNLVTTDFAYARLIGDRKAVNRLTNHLDHIVIDQSKRIASWGELLSDLVPGVKETFAFCNNHFAGFAPATIADLAQVAQEKGLHVQAAKASRSPDTLFD